MRRDLVRLSKFLSRVLRHDPDAIGITLDAGGWTDVAQLLARSRGRLDTHLLGEIVETNDKQRFAFSEDRARIRASQGHSIDVDLGLDLAEPPTHLYHGTARRNLDSIRTNGLHAGTRQHVHLSPDKQTATKVGQRHGKPVVLIVKSGEMFCAGHSFFLSHNRVWLVDSVPADYVE